MSGSTKQDAPSAAPGRSVGGLPLQVYVVFGALGALVVSQQWLVPRLDSPALATWSTIFVAIVVQSIPFLVGGVWVIVVSIVLWRQESRTGAPMATAAAV